MTHLRRTDAHSRFRGDGRVIAPIRYVRQRRTYLGPHLPNPSDLCIVEEVLPHGFQNDRERTLLHGKKLANPRITMSPFSSNCVLQVVTKSRTHSRHSQSDVPDDAVPWIDQPVDDADAFGHVPRSRRARLGEDGAPPRVRLSGGRPGHDSQPLPDEDPSA